MRAILAFLLLVSVCFASLLWDVDVNGAARTSPIVFNDKIIVASEDGNVYSLNKDSSRVAWKTQVGKAVDTIEYGGKLFVLTKDALIIGLDTTGKESWRINLQNINITGVYGLGKGSRGVYVSTDKGIYRIDGTATSVYSEQGNYTKPTIADSYIIFGVDNYIKRIDTEGRLQWSREIDENVWTSNPVVSGQGVYLGALDNKLHSLTLSGGYERWVVVTGGWVLSTPLVYNGNVYFGSNDGYVYAVDENSGITQWKTKIGFAVVEKPEAGVIGGEPVIFVGSTDGSIYGLMLDTGEVVWEASATDRVGKPLYYQNRVYFGSHDGYVYVHDTERACSIETPGEGEFVGYKEIVVRGKSVSEVGSQQVFIRINNGGWIEAEVSSDGDWIYYLDPQKDLVESINSISCRVVDLGGEETGDSFTTVNFIRDSSLPLENIEITVVPEKPLVGEQFTVHINSLTDGSPLDRVTVTVNGQSYDVDNNVTTSLGNAGTYRIEASKLGYNTKSKNVEIVSGEISPLWYIGGGVIGVILLWVVFTQVTKFFKKKE